MRMDILNIRMNIATFAIVLAQAVTVVWIVANMAAKVDQQVTQTTEIKQQLQRDAQDNKIWRAKMEADIADLKVRVALLEARINNLYE